MLSLEQIIAAVIQQSRLIEMGCNPRLKCRYVILNPSYGRQLPMMMLELCSVYAYQDQRSSRFLICGLEVLFKPGIDERVVKVLAEID